MQNVPSTQTKEDGTPAPNLSSKFPRTRAKSTPSRRTLVVGSKKPVAVGEGDDCRSHSQVAHCMGAARDMPNDGIHSHAKPGHPKRTPNRGSCVGTNGMPSEPYQHGAKCPAHHVCGIGVAD